eukprot:CAMPEP_0119544868 /NCGR_PEP_ID=MMETSP1344-20130328/54950_1 /TAXON_ID=236787 /ORGANISM="Florenciella parvula, Strain CCMP2471" /LENGTH=490 /DNA_ID=CAMNT_0007589375 /DNA_START=829 /DNA_END=2306 /DNA_ORIENTATION=-
MKMARKSLGGGASPPECRLNVSYGGGGGGRRGEVGAYDHALTKGRHELSRHLSRGSPSRRSSMGDGERTPVSPREEVRATALELVGRDGLLRLFVNGDVNDLAYPEAASSQDRKSGCAGAWEGYAVIGLASNSAWFPIDLVSTWFCVEPSAQSGRSTTPRAHRDPRPRRVSNAALVESEEANDANPIGGQARKAASTTTSRSRLIFFAGAPFVPSYLSIQSIRISWHRTHSIQLGLRRRYMRSCAAALCACRRMLHSCSYMVNTDSSVASYPRRSSRTLGERRASLCNWRCLEQDSPLLEPPDVLFDVAPKFARSDHRLHCQRRRLLLAIGPLAVRLHPTQEAEQRADVGFDRRGLHGAASTVPADHPSPPRLERRDLGGQGLGDRSQLVSARLRDVGLVLLELGYQAVANSSSNAISASWQAAVCVIWQCASRVRGGTPSYLVTVLGLFQNGLGIEVDPAYSARLLARFCCRPLLRERPPQREQDVFVT